MFDALQWLPFDSFQGCPVPIITKLTTPSQPHLWPLPPALPLTAAHIVPLPCRSLMGWELGAAQTKRQRMVLWRRRTGRGNSLRRRWARKARSAAVPRSVAGSCGIIQGWSYGASWRASTSTGESWSPSWSTPSAWALNTMNRYKQLQLLKSVGG